MITDLYQEYLYLIGKLKDSHHVTFEVEHRNIHTFYKDKKPLFKLFFGNFNDKSKSADEGSIVVSFHIELTHYDAIQWFANMYTISPVIQVHDSYIEDSKGETYLGEDAKAIQEILLTQDVLEKWLEEHTEEDMREFVEADVVGDVESKGNLRSFVLTRDEADLLFNKKQRPDDGEEVH